MKVVDDLEGTIVIASDEEEGESEEARRGGVGELQVFDPRPGKGFLAEANVGNAGVGFGEVVPRTDNVDSVGVEEREEGRPHRSVWHRLPRAWGCWRRFEGLGSESEDFER